MPDERRCRTSELEIAYEVSGREHGRPAVLVHGWPDGVRCWDALIEQLAEEDLRFYAPYLRGCGPTRFLRDDTPRSGAIAALILDLKQFLDQLALTDVLLVGYDWGARAAYGVAALFPERIHAMVTGSAGYATGVSPAEMPYELAQSYWYEWYACMERGREAYRSDRVRLSRHLWETWSPDWPNKAADFAAIVPSLDNPDWAEVSIHAYRQRWREVEGAPEHEDVERRLAENPPIPVPTIMLQGGVDRDNIPSTSEGKEKYFSRHYERRLLEAVGHFIPYEAPDAFAAAMRELLEKSS